MKRVGVKTVYRAIKILETIGEQGSKSVSELARQLHFPKSSTFEILATLEREGILEKDHERSTYRLGLKLFELGSQAQGELEIRRVAIPHMKSLNQQLDETVHLTILDKQEVLYIECFESTKRLRTYSVIGVRAPLYCTAVGKAILAYLDPKEIDEIIKAKGLPRFTANTLTTRQALLEDLKKTVERGYAVDKMEHEEGMCCVGAPIRNHTGKVFASMSVSGPSQRMTPAAIRETAKSLVAQTREISARLGYRGSL